MLQSELSSKMSKKTAQLLSYYFKASSKYVTNDDYPKNDQIYIEKLFLEFIIKNPEYMSFELIQEMEKFIKSWLKNNIKGLVHGDFFLKILLLKMIIF